MWAWLLLACGSTPEPAATVLPPEPEPTVAKTPVQPPPAASGERCDPTLPVPSRGLSVPVQLVLGKGLKQEDVAPYLRSGAQTLAPWGVRLELAERVAQANTLHLLGGDQLALRELLKSTPKAEQPPLIAEWVLAPVEPLLDQVSRPKQQPGVVLVIARTVAAPSSPAAQVLGGHAGLTLRHDLGAQGKLAELSPYLPKEPYTPTIFLAYDQLRGLGETRSGYVLAHELGHAMGLEHSTDAGNLMAAEVPRCAPHLTTEQLQALHW